LNFLRGFFRYLQHNYIPEIQVRKTSFQEKFGGYYKKLSNILLYTVFIRQIFHISCCILFGYVYVI
jgi:hypothetical protein